MLKTEPFEIKYTAGFDFSQTASPYSVLSQMVATATPTSTTDASVTYSLVGDISSWSNAASEFLPGYMYTIDTLTTSDLDWTQYAGTLTPNDIPNIVTTLGVPESEKSTIIAQWQCELISNTARRVSVWVVGQGLIINQVIVGATPTTTNFSTTFTIPAPTLLPHTVVKGYSFGPRDLPHTILTAYWSHISKDEYGVITEPATTDYRPSAVYNGSTLLSCNRTGGARKIYGPEGWLEMASDGSTPPSIRNATTLVPQQKTGQE